MKKIIFMLSLAFVAIVSAVTIQEINGPTITDGKENWYVSPYKDQPVTDVEGIITAIKYSEYDGAIEPGNFYIQSETPDDDPRTSEGLLVYAYSEHTAGLSVGDKVSVNGVLREFVYPTADETDLTIREISQDSENPLTVTYISSGNPVRVTKIGTKVDAGNPDKRIIPTEKFYPVDYSKTLIENGANEYDLRNVDADLPAFDPEHSGLDFWRSMQGMIVEIDNPVFVAPTFFTKTTKKTTNYLVADNGEGATGLSSRHTMTISLDDRNPEMIKIEPEMFPRWMNNAMPDVLPGDRIDGSFTGVVDYTYGAYKIFYTDSTQIAQDLVIDGSHEKEVTNLTATDDQLTVSSFNVENLNPMDDQIKFDNLAKGIVNNLKNPDIIALEEVMDNNGTINDGAVAADQTYNKLSAAVTAQGGVSYSFAQVDPVNGQDGGFPGGNIRVGFFYNPERVSFTERTPQNGENIQTDAVYVEDVAGKPQLSWNPGRIDPQSTMHDSTWTSSRKPLVAEFEFKGNKFFVIANHFASKRGDKQKYEGRWQAPYLASERQRINQAHTVASFMESILEVHPNANVIAMGDWNDFQFSNPLLRLTHKEDGTKFMYNLDELLPEEERFAYVYSGNSQALDHILVSKNIRWLASKAPEFDVVHINSHYRKDNRLSDHDPEVARLSIPAVGIKDENLAVKSNRIDGCYPNPFNPTATISYIIAKAGKVKLAAYNYKGELVSELVNNTVTAGAHNVSFNGKNLASGVYYLKLSVNGVEAQSFKTVLLK